ncbi:MAG: hypothetical protein HOE69_03305 [Euryarchaeota archaeon]|jgi:proteasome lid subunit RPN8/RPN11|nr:hypothetical protein [Euryarchaeota archaeon]
MSKKNGKAKFAFGPKTKDYPAIVCTDLISQSEAFTAPRGRVEMGGLLLGHVDENGNNVAVCGFFPKQTEENSGYCEFGGMYNAIAAAACDYANDTVKGEKMPKLRIIGWIHTHPNIGIFLSAIDVNTYRMLRNQCHNRRFMAVVVDPLKGEHGVFLTERKSETFSDADGVISLSQELEARYHILLDRLRSIQKERGLDFLPCILPGHLRGKRNAMGDRDDIEIELQKGFFQLKKQIVQLNSNSNQNASDVKQRMANFHNELDILKKENQTLKHNSHAMLDKHTHAIKRINTLEERLLIVEKLISDLKKLQSELNNTMKNIHNDVKQTMIKVQQEIKHSQLQTKNETIDGVKAVIRGARMKAKMYTDTQLEELRKELHVITNGDINITTDKSANNAPQIAILKVQHKKLNGKE